MPQAGGEHGTSEFHGTGPLPHTILDQNIVWVTEMVGKVFTFMDGYLAEALHAGKANPYPE